MDRTVYKTYKNPTDNPWNNLSMADKAVMMEVAIRNGITTLPEIREAYNEFAEGGDVYSEEDKLQQDINIYPGGGWLGMMPAMPSTALSGGVDAIRKRLYENITPFGYHDPISRTFNAVVKNQQDNTRADENKRIRKFDPQASALDAIWATYLNIPENQRRKINPRYGISKTKDGYYRFNNPGMIFDFERDLSSEGLYSLPGRKAVMMSGILGNYTTGLARDKKGDYMFYSDSRLNPDGTPNIKTGWDINPYSNTVDNDTEETTEERGQYGQNRKDWSYKLGKTLFGNVEDISMDIGTAVPIYDKIYLDDYYEVPQEARGGNYLPEVTVIGKRKKKALGGNLYPYGGTKKQTFLSSLDQSLKEDKRFDNAEWRQFFTDLANQESGYRSDVTNSIGAKGYFQLMPFNRAKAWKNPTQQFHEMYKLTGNNLNYLNKNLTKEDWKRADALGIDMYGMLAGAHLGGAGNVLKALRGKGNAKDMNGSSVMGYMTRFSQRGKTPTLATPSYVEEAPIPLFTPSNPEVFFGGYKAPEIEAPLPSIELEDTPQYSEEEIARQERKERLNNLSMLMNLTSPQGSSNSMLDALGLLMR